MVRNRLRVLRCILYFFATDTMEWPPSRSFIISPLLLSKTSFCEDRPGGRPSRLRALRDYIEDQEGAAPYIAELYAMRGLFHFHLATYFAPIPTSGSANTMGLMLADKVHDISYIGERATLGLRARAYPYWGKYAEALADCKELLKDSPYTLYTPENYTSIWSQEGTASEQSSRQTPRPCFLSLRRSSTLQKASLFRTLATATKSLQS